MRWGAGVTDERKRVSSLVPVADRVHQDVTCDVRELLARELILSVQARKSRAFPTPLARRRTPRPHRTFLFFGGTSSAQMRAPSSPQDNEITCARRVLSNTESGLLQIGKIFPSDREFFPRLMQQCHTKCTLYSFILIFR
jgi:hypothetical protein